MNHVRAAGNDLPSFYCQSQPWHTPKRFIEHLRRFSKKDQLTFEQAKEQLEELLEEGDVEGLNRNQRIVLLAEEFDFEVLKTAEWLTERYDVDIRCYRLSLAKGGNEVFLTCTRAYPPPELTELSIRRRRKKEVGGEETTDWDEALGSVKNSAVVAFFRQELAEGRSNNPKYKALRFYIGDRRRFVVQAKQEWARVWQGARFDDDIEFWKSRLGERARIKPMRGGQRLRFHLADEADFSKFKKAAAAELMTVEFNDHGDESTDEPGNEAE